jgi:hypothetical protein
MSTAWKRLVFVCVGLASASLAGWAAEKAQPGAGEAVELTTLMHAKLASSQKITEGLVTKDFELIRKGAEDWRRIASATKWHGQSDPVFAEHLAEFSRQADKLVRTADEKNLDAATYAYMGSLRTCIGCHEYCRDVLHIPPMRKNPKAVSPIPVTDEETGATVQPGTSR